MARADFISIQVFAVILIIGGFALRYWMNRRRFNRNNFAGVQVFKSYEHKTIIELVEKVVKIVAIIMILAGAYLIFMVRFVDKGILPKKQPQESEVLKQ